MVQYSIYTLLLFLGKAVSPCKGNQFSCGSGECIPLKLKCDFNPDCADGSDEFYSCGKHHFFIFKFVFIILNNLLIC